MSLFGTDGIRGPFAEPPLTRPILERIGGAAARLLDLEESSRPVLLAGDTRASTAEICSWLAAGLHSAGASSVFGGVLPTPAISKLTRALELPLGIAVSASHNPFPDNGVKLIREDGSKWDSTLERQLEETLETTPEMDVEAQALEEDQSLAGSYSDMLVTALAAEGDLEGLRVTLDCAHGAASGLAVAIFARLGAEVDVINDRPDGRNINRGCGSTSPQAMAERTRESGSHVGFAFDGDADRVIAADETGTIHDGDATLFLLARDFHRRGLLEPARIVATTMSNLGLEVALAREGIDIERCDVGDRVVVETLRSEGLVLGGEQSGHIVHLGLGPTGDGIQTALLLARLAARGEAPLSAQLADFKLFPQILENVRVAEKPDLTSLPAVRSTVDEVTASLGTDGRLVLRYSGTEPLARIMIEGPDQSEVEALAARLAAVIRQEIGAEG